ncbi:MAG: response regulator [Planctomycetota bacterium]
MTTAEVPTTDNPIRLSIVALDDDADFREYIKALLEEEGHDAEAVATDGALFERCERALPDIVLLDVAMGPVRGEDVLAEIRERWPKLCVVIVTGHASLESMRTLFKQDAFDYLTKPFGIEELNQVLAQAAERYQLGRRPQDRLRHELGRRIRLARTERGWTLKGLSETSGVSVSQLSSIERGAHLPSLESLLSVADALGQRPSAWLDEAGF